MIRACRFKTLSCPMSYWSLYDTETWQLQLQNPPLPILQMQLFIYSCIFNKFSDRSLGSEIPELEIMTDRPTNQPTDQRTGSQGSFTSNKLLMRIVRLKLIDRNLHVETKSQLLKSCKWFAILTGSFNSFDVATQDFQVIWLFVKYYSIQ